MLSLKTEFPALNEREAQEAAFPIAEQATLESALKELTFEAHRDLVFLHETTKVGVGGPPHQVLAFLLNRPLEFGPTRIIKDVSALPLADLARVAESEYIGASMMPRELIRLCFEPLHHAMTQTVQQVNSRHARHTPPPDLNAVVGQTTLNNYFRGDAARQIS
jgi:hypothetical protein